MSISGYEPSETLPVQRANCFNPTLFQQMQCCRLSLGTNLRRPEFVTLIAGTAAARLRRTRSGWR